MDCRDAARYKLNTLTNLRELDISGLRHPLDALDALTELIRKALEIPTLESIRIPHSYTANDAIERNINHVLFRSAFWSACRTTSVQIIEEHARYFVRKHQWCRKPRHHICEQSAPHELCSPGVYDPVPCKVDFGLKWNCADVGHTTCACIWDFDGTVLLRGFGASSTPPEFRLPIGADSYQCMFLDLDQPLQLV
uniref:Uncharacterized protein n=1 Tax=Mycena chlorophos TaxID=658473 RepID=A0ABQ0M8I3_MYCCL|nr:predicted protein [Mycena chlorophos]